MVCWACARVTVMAVIAVEAWQQAWQQAQKPNAVIDGPECSSPDVVNLELATDPNHQGPECPLSPADVKKAILVDGMQKKGRTHLKYYLHEYTDIFEPVTECYFSLNGIDLSKDDWDEHLAPKDAEHIGEMWLFKKLRQHSQRTMMMDSADVHILAIPAFVSLYASSRRSPCGPLDHHVKRMKEVTKRLKTSPVFQSKGRTFFMASSHFHVNSMFTDELLDLFQEANATLGVGDLKYNNFKFGNSHERLRKVVMPYKAHYLSDDFSSRDDAGDVSLRTTSVFFHGCKGRRGDHGVREYMFKNMNNLNRKRGDLNVQDICVSQHSAASIEAKTEDLMSKSRFCLVPVGDTPTSRRLFDGLATGCVPIYVGNWDDMIPNLPFPRTIDWSSIVMFGGSSGCDRAGSPVLATWIKDVIHDDRVWKTMSSAGRQAYRNYLSYTTGSGFVDALLHEIVHAS